nr:MAG TPA: hypothetical protein [Microviridae sp.]
MKTWNIRDQTEEALRTKVESLYKEIEKSYRLLKKMSRLEDAQAMIDNIWSMKALANDIQLELLRREYDNGTTS